MITPTEYIQLKAYARQDGFFLGLLWIITFACLIYSTQDPTLQIGFMIGALATPFIVFYRLRHFRDKILEGCISFKRAFAFVALMMGYASVIMAAATYIYFSFIDNGTFMNMLQQNISLPEVRKSFVQAGIDIKEMENQLQIMSQIRPIDFAISIFSNGIISAIFMGLIIGVIGKSYNSTKQQQ